MKKLLLNSKRWKIWYNILFYNEKKTNSINLAFYIQIRKGVFTSSVEFENSEKDETNKVIRDYFIIIAIIIVIVGLIVLIIYLIYKNFKSKYPSHQTN